jgi:hypothetical protein
MLGAPMRSIACQFAGAYLVLAVVLWLFSFQRGKQGPTHV